jgi:hypothetical protein
MRFELTRFPPIRYTMLESHLFDKLPKNGRKFGSDDVVKMREGMGEWDVKFPLKNATVTMQRLMDKIDDNEEPFRIVKAGKEAGHHKVEYWLEARTPVRKKRKANGQ